MLAYVFLRDKKLRIKPTDLLLFDFSNVRPYLKAALSVTGTLLNFALGMSAHTQYFGHSSTAALAANSIMGIVWQITGVVGLTCGSASAIIIGKAIGEGKEEMINAYSKTLQLLYILIASFPLLPVCPAAFHPQPLRSDARDDGPCSQDDSRSLLYRFCHLLPIPRLFRYYSGGREFQIQLHRRHHRHVAHSPAAGMDIGLYPEMAPLVTFCILRNDQFIKVFVNGYWVNYRQWYRRLIK